MNLKRPLKGKEAVTYAEITDLKTHLFGNIVMISERQHK